MAKPDTESARSEESVQADIDTFFNAVNTQLQAGGCESIADAANRAFRELKKPEGVWNGNAYGPHTVHRFMRQFTPDQNGKLRESLGLPALPRAIPRPVSKIDRFERNAALREQFLTSAAANPSRPHLALEYDLPLELVDDALYAAIKAEFNRNGLSGIHSEHATGTIPAQIDRINQQITRVASLRDEWQELTSFRVSRVEGTKILYLHTEDGWPLHPSQDEKDVLRTLREDRRLAREVEHAQEEKPTETVNSGGFSQRIAGDLIGTGGRVTRRP